MNSSFPLSRRLHFLMVATFVACVSPLSLAAAPAADEAAADALPPNLGKGLRQLVVWHRAQPPDLAAPERRARLAKALPGRASRLQTDTDATRAVVDVTLDGGVPLAAVSAALTRLGAEVFARFDSGRAGSILSVRLPLDQAEAAAKVPGVASLALVHRPWQRVGKVTSQGAAVLGTPKANQMGYDGTGITVGVISDSYDKEGNDQYGDYFTTASSDVRNGDLPGPGNPLGHTLPVKVISDAFPGDSQTDEGRAMLQIVHDLAPGAQLMFRNAGTTAETLASAITDLRSQTDPACDVIVDDFGFPDEPFFSDGPAALAARDAVTSLLLPGHPVVYVSSAGNEGDQAYAADFNPVADAAARGGLGTGNLKLDQVPSSLTAGGFHNFNPKTNKTTLAQKVKMHEDAEVSFQWDDPFVPGEVTANYNLLVFDAEGNYLPDLSGTDDNIKMGNAVEVVDLPLGDGNKSVTYQLAITRANSGTGLAQHLHYVMSGGGDAVIKFRGYNHGTTFGHNAGPSVIGVAAYPYDGLARTESYSSLGPVTIYFDSQGNRLATPEVRQQPAVAAVDGVNTSFFPPGPLKLADGTPGTDTDNDGFPNFSGTSAAAPHAAAVAALLLQAAGGPGSLTAAQVQTLLQSTALAHDLDPNFVSTSATPGDGSKVTLTATADESDAASADKDGFHLTFDGGEGQYLKKVVINLASTNLRFDNSADLGFPFTVGTKTGVAVENVTATLNGDNTALTLLFAPNAFPAGESLNFGIDRDLTDTGTNGNSAELLAGAIVKVRTKGAGGGGRAQGTLDSKVGTGYSADAGFGLVDAVAAIRSVLANPPAKNDARLIPGDLLLATSENRLIEITRAGVQVQVVPVPNPLGSGGRRPNEYIEEAVVDGNGNIVVLNGVYTPYLTTISSRTGAITNVTAPGWELSRNRGEIVPLGQYVFANYGQADYTNPRGLLLRYDINTGTIQAFGSPATNPNKAYVSLSAGPDGLLYALVDTFGLFAGPGTNMPGASVDVYDPNTLTLLRTVYLNIGTPDNVVGLIGPIAVGPAGEFYALPSGFYNTHAIYKLDASGQKVASLNLPISAAERANNGVLWSNVRVDSKGNVVVGALEPILIDPAFQTAISLDVYGANLPIAGTAVTATFIGF